MLAATTDTRMPRGGACLPGVRGRLYGAGAPRAGGHPEARPALTACFAHGFSANAGYGDPGGLEVGTLFLRVRHHPPTER